MRHSLVLLCFSIAYDFLTNADETLTVIVDGSDVAIALNANIADLASAASGITIAGATIVVDGSYLKITSASTGTSSTITIKSDSGQTDRDRDKSINRSRW